MKQKEFVMPVYRAPDFTEERFANAPDAAFAVCDMDGGAPDGYHSTSMYPEYFKIDGQWRLAEESRMDCTVVLRDSGVLDVVEQRNRSNPDEWNIENRTGICPYPEDDRITESAEGT